jgi:lipopolysaccharide assembly outer membrane protein LptD (OstA)
MGLVQLLTTEGFNVQLRHIEAEEEATRDRVWLKNDKGEQLAFHADMQHNRNYHMMAENAQALFDEAKAKMATATETTCVEATASEETIFASKATEISTDTSTETVVASNA